MLLLFPFQGCDSKESARERRGLDWSAQSPKSNLSLFAPKRDPMPPAFGGWRHLALRSHRWMNFARARTSLTPDDLVPTNPEVTAASLRWHPNRGRQVAVRLAMSAPILVLPRA